MHLKKILMWGRVPHILAVPWGFYFNTLKLNSDRMERENFMCLLKNKLNIIKEKKGMLTMGWIAKRKAS